MKFSIIYIQFKKKFSIKKFSNLVIFSIEATSGSWYIVTYFSFLPDMILQNDKGSKARARIFSGPQNATTFNNLNTNKNLIAFFLYKLCSIFLVTN